MKIYLAARYGRRHELCAYRADLEQLGHTITSTWLNGEDEAFDTAMPPEMAPRWAQRDLEDVFSARCLIAFTEAPNSGQARGGRHVEFGVALALDHRLMVVGPRENIFYMLPHIQQFDTFEACWDALRREAQ